MKTIITTHSHREPTTANTIKEALELEILKLIYSDGRLYGYGSYVGTLNDGRLFTLKFNGSTNCITIKNKKGATRYWANGGKEYYRSGATDKALFAN